MRLQQTIQPYFCKSHLCISTADKGSMLNVYIRGISAIETLIALAALSLLITMAVPIGNHIQKRENLSTAHSSLSQGIEKAITTAVYNEKRLERTEPSAALCLTQPNQLSVLKATSNELPNCAAGTGSMVWSASVPENIDITSNGDALNCLCFDRYGLLTTNSCPVCSAETSFELKPQ